MIYKSCLTRAVNFFMDANIIPRKNIKAFVRGVNNRFTIAELENILLWLIAKFIYPCEGYADHRANKEYK